MAGQELPGDPCAYVLASWSLPWSVLLSSEAVHGRWWPALGHSPGTSWGRLAWGVSPPHPLLGAQVTHCPPAASLGGGLLSLLLFSLCGTQNS